MSLSAKSITSGLLRRLMASERNGLSRVGRLLIRAAEHIQFHGRGIQQDWFFGQPPDLPAIGWKTSNKGKIVYDFGANRGSNIQYYLSRGFDVVAIEANPLLAERLVQSFSKDIRVKVVSACIVPDSEMVDVPFFINNRLDKLSTFVRPAASLEDFEEIRVPARTPASIIREFGEPFYVKIDLEGADHLILNSLLGNGEKPPYISTEAHTLEAFRELIVFGYSEFKVVEGRYVHKCYYSPPETCTKAAYRFDKGESAGPFGEDIPGPWLSADEILAYLCKFGTGWKDIHARRSDLSEEGA
jgi:FkbM family methyltransferase